MGSLHVDDSWWTCTAWEWITCFHMDNSIKFSSLCSVCQHGECHAAGMGVQSQHLLCHNYICEVMQSYASAMLQLHLCCRIHAGTSLLCHLCLQGLINAYVDGLVQERRNSIALAMELHLSCTNLSITLGKIHMCMWCNYRTLQTLMSSLWHVESYVIYLVTL